MSTLILKDQVIEKVQATINSYKENKIIAHTVSGKPLSIKEYRA